MGITGASAQTAASLGYYVNTVAASAQTPAELGRYVAVTGATAAMLATVGHYVGVTGASAQTAASLGYYVNTSGASSQIAAEVGHYVAVTGATVASVASVGYYVNTVAASAQTPAELGRYVAVTGATVAMLATVGHYVGVTGASSQTSADLGYYVSQAGASAQVAAPLGHYVGVTAAAFATPADVGHYVGITGASAQTAASLGYYVNTTGASAQTAASPGHYVSTTAATVASPASPGYYVSTFGASNQMAAPEGYYVSNYAATEAIRATHSYIVGQLASTAEPLINDGLSGASLSPLNLNGTTVKIIGNLSTSRAIDIGNGSSGVEVDNNITAQLDGGVNGLGSLAKTGSGLLKLSGNVNISGDLTASSGVLQVDGSVTNRAVISSGAALQGSGQVGAVINRGTLNIGGNTGAINIIGNYASEANSLLNVHLSPSNIPTLQVGGQAVLNGNLSYNLSAGSYVTSHRYTVLQATGGITGTLNVLPSSMAGYVLTNSIDANTVSFELAYKDLASVGTTANRYRAGAMLDAVKTNATGDLLSVVNLISSQTESVADSLLGRLTANQILGYAWSEQQKYDLASRAVANRLNAYSMGNRLQNVKEGEMNGWAILQGMGANNSSSYLPYKQTVTNTGISVGADYKLNNESGYGLWGIGFSALNGNIGIQDGGRFTGATYIFQLYGKNQRDDLSLDYSIAYGLGNVKQSRGINLIDESRVANSSPSSSGLDISTRLSKYFNLGGHHELRPYFGIGYRRVNINAYQETGAQSLNLSVDQVKVDAKTYQLGVKYANQIDWGGYVLRPAIDLSMRGQVASKDIDVRQTLLDGSGAATFNSNLGSYTYPSMTISLEALTGKNFTTTVMVRGDKQSDFWVWGTQFGMKYRW